MTEPFLPANKARYAMGLGTPAQLWNWSRAGVDMFDCVLADPRGAQWHRLHAQRAPSASKAALYKADFRPIEEGC